LKVQITKYIGFLGNLRNQNISIKRELKEEYRGLFCIS